MPKELQLPDFEMPLVLTRCEVARTFPGGVEINLEAEVELCFRPSPDLRVRYRSRHTPTEAVLAMLEPQDEALRLPPTVLPTGTPADADEWSTAGFNYSGSRRFGSLGVTGDPSDVSAIRVLVINLDDVASRHPLVLEARGWRIRLEVVDGARDQLRAEGGFAITHVMWIDRPDGGINVDQLGDLLDGLFHFLAFVNGGLVGLALPTGFDAAGAPVWCQWSTTTSDPWNSSLNWFDPTLSGELARLYESWDERCTDSEFWTLVLRRIARIIAAANEPKPMDMALTTAGTGLELLSWAVLKVDKQWIATDSGDLTAAGMARLTLGWADIPREVPEELKHLAAVASERSLDGPAAVTWVRNRIVHPPKRPSDGWPSTDLMIDSWRLVLDYLELLVLRILGYRGKYAHRRHIAGRLTGATDPVPWATQPETQTIDIPEA